MKMYKSFKDKPVVKEQPPNKDKSPPIPKKEPPAKDPKINYRKNIYSTKIK